MKNKGTTVFKIMVLVVIVFFYILYLVCNSKYVLAKRFFNVNVYKYDVTKVENTLSNSDYTGKYEMIIRVEESQFDEFVDDIKLGAVEEKYEMELLNKEYFGDEPLDGGIFLGISTQKRNICFPIFSSMTKSIYTIVRYEKPENGGYKVTLIYKEL